MFIVIEGLDGAGKSTQVAMIRSELKSRGIDSEYLHFPRFDAPIFGDMIARFLRGEFGSAGEVNPYLVGLLYAGDRANASSMIQQWLDSGKSVIVDRYLFSNIAYQCAKIGGTDERENLREWIFDLEYNKYGIVKPDLSIFLDVPFGFTQKKLAEQRDGDDREYLKGGSDIHEASLTLQQQVREVYINEAAREDSELVVIDCATDDGDMLPAQQIFEKIMLLIGNILK